MSLLYDVSVRFWEDIISRPSGPLAFRFILQPVMASLLAIRDGYKDARDGRPPYLATIIHDPVHRDARLREGLKAVSRVILLGIAMDLLYQFLVIKAFRPIEMLNVVFVLAFLPYLLLRGPAGRLVRWWRQRSDGPQNLLHG